MKFDISKFNPCSEAVLYYTNQASFRDAWTNCQRGDWMLWIAQKLGVDIRTLTKAKALCAKTVEHLMKDQRSKDAIQAALDFADGKISKDQLKTAAYAAAAAAYDAAAYAAAAYDAAAYAARLRNRRQTADICREVLTDAVFALIGKE